MTGARPAGGTAPAARRRSGWRIALVGVALAASAFVWMQQRATWRSAFPQVEGRIRSADVSAPLVLVRDARGVPHVLAESEADAYWGVGYAHAQDRLGQMLWLRARAAGRAAEFAGAGLLADDRRARVLGFARYAEASLAGLPDDTRAMLTAYAAGVNARMARIASGEEDAPLVVRDLGLPLDPWQPADSLSLVKLHAWSLGGALETHVVLSELIRKLGSFEARLFFPDAAAPLRAGLAPLGSRTPAPPDTLRRALGLDGASAGSNAFVVAGSRTRTGRPLLAADLHLEPRAPAVLHQVHASGGALDAAGATLPGVPVFWAGRNERVAWAGTWAGTAVTDIFVETFSPADADRYHDGGTWRDAEVREEVIRVRGGEDRTLRIVSTRHGPRVDDLVGAAGVPLALAWTGALPGDGVTGLLRAARARDAGEFRSALAAHHEPVLAFVYADVTGAGGRQVAGTVPQRRSPSGLVPVPGRAHHYDWTGPIPFARLPHRPLRRSPPWLVAADNALWGDGEVESLWRSGERADRLVRRLRAAVARGDVDLAALGEIQRDVYSARAHALVLAALERAGPEAGLGREAREAAAYLRDWDGRARSDSIGAATSHVFLRRLVQRLFAERTGPELLERYLALPRSHPHALLAPLLGEAPPREVASLVEPAPLAGAVRASLRDAWLWLSVKRGANRARWSWGELHRLRFRTPRGVDGTLAARGLGPMPYPGDGATLASGDYDPTGDFDVRLASTYRLLVDLGEPRTSLSSLAPGQSEHPGHPHYADAVERWLHGRPGPLSSSRLWIEEQAAARLEVEPAP